MALGLVFAVGCSPGIRPERKACPLPAEPEVWSGRQGKPGGVFVDTVPGEPNTFNWLVSEDATSASFLGLLFDGLTSWDPVREKVIPALARSWEVGPDNQTFTFHLRKGLRWSDGIPLTADDVLFTFQCLYDPRYPNRYGLEFTVKGKPFLVEKVDQWTVRIRTPGIFAPFLRNVGDLPIMPRHILETAWENGTLQKQWTVSDAQRHPERLVGTGPYRIRSYRPGERIVLEPNPCYWKVDLHGVRLPYIDFLITRFVKDQNASLIAFASGQTDAESIAPDQVGWVQRLAPIHHFRIYDRGPSTSSTFLWFNQNPGRNKDGKPFVDPVKLRWFTDRRFRQAISYAIDREGMVRGVLFGRGAPLWGPESPANTKWYNPNVKKYPYNPSQALALLAEAGFVRGDDGVLRDSRGNVVQFTLLTNQENPLRTAMATVIKENLKAIGIEMELQFLDFGALVNKIADSYDYEACLLGLTGGGDPADGMSVFLSKGRLHQWYPNQPHPATPWEARIDELMEKQLSTLDEAVRKKCYDEVQEIMSEELPFIYLVTPNAYAGLKERWYNIDVPKIGSIVWNLDRLWTP
ncbi:ABC transporter substrate-binding protein [Candidatus Methylacidithermus pantelleriae]|uniref:ABC transporter substrate-binding protein n=1 Tax=Candidatus Methylacidithermus pantelleriae TaxID=2744239 RepID=UPI001F1C15CE|nr:ABC transporter substrate-binding protein [Candidatus Methylacidithermus pantelleriae]